MRDHNSHLIALFFSQEPQRCAFDQIWMASGIEKCWDNPVFSLGPRASNKFKAKTAFADLVEMAYDGLWDCKPSLWAII